MEHTREELALEAALRLGYNSPKLNVNTKQAMIACRHGHGTKSPCCSISITNNWVNCFSCGEHGSLTKLFYEEFGHSISKELGVETATFKSGLRDPFANSRVEVSYEDIPKTNFEFHGTFIPINSHEPSKKYLEKRGITLKVAEDFKMKFAVRAASILKDDNSQIVVFSNRLIIPIYEKNILSVEGRDIYGEESFHNKMKSLGKENCDYKKCLYPKGSSTSTLFQLSRLKKDKTLYITEGLMDLAVLRTHKDFENSTTIFGSTVTQRQLYLLSKFNDIVYIHNNDRAGWQSVRKIFNYRNGNLKILTPPKNCGDIGDIIEKGMTIDECIQLKWLEKIYQPTLEKIDKKITELENKK